MMTQCGVPDFICLVACFFLKTKIFWFREYYDSFKKADGYFSDQFNI